MSSVRPDQKTHQVAEVCALRDLMELGCSGCVYNGYELCRLAGSGGKKLHNLSSATIDRGHDKNKSMYYRSGHNVRHMHDY